MNRALFERNANACENAKGPTCTCACGGALHGKSHAGKMQELWDAYLERERAEKTEANQEEIAL